MTEKVNRIAGIDLVKAFAIVWICLYHLLDFSYGWSIGEAFAKGNLVTFFSQSGNLFEVAVNVFLAFGVLGVNLFVIASGAGLYLLRIRNEGEPDWRFLWKRFGKIMPLYYFLLLTVLIFNVLRGHSINLPDYVAHFLCIHTFIPAFVTGISTPLWYMGLITQLYVLFPLIYRLVIKVNPLLLLILMMLVRIFGDPFLVWLWGEGRFFSEYLFDFCFGLVVGQLLYKNGERFDSWFYVVSMGLAGLFFYLIATKAVSYLLVNVLYPVSAALLFIGLLSLGSHVKTRVWQKVAELSYAVYLIHYFLLTWVWNRIPLFDFWLSGLLFLISSFLLGFLFNQFFLVVKSIIKKAFMRKPALA